MEWVPLCAAFHTSQPRSCQVWLSGPGCRPSSKLVAPDAGLSLCFSLLGTRLQRVPRDNGNCSPNSGSHSSTQTIAAEIQQSGARSLHSCGLGSAWQEHGEHGSRSGLPPNIWLCSPLLSVKHPCEIISEAPQKVLGVNTTGVCFIQEYSCAWCVHSFISYCIHAVCVCRYPSLYLCFVRQLTKGSSLSSACWCIQWLN